MRLAACNSTSLLAKRSGATVRWASPPAAAAAPQSPVPLGGCPPAAPAVWAKTPARPAAEVAHAARRHHLPAPPAPPMDGAVAEVPSIVITTWGPPARLPAKSTNTTEAATAMPTAASGKTDLPTAPALARIWMSPATPSKAAAPCKGGMVGPSLSMGPPRSPARLRGPASTSAAGRAITAAAAKATAKALAKEDPDGRHAKRWAATRGEAPARAATRAAARAARASMGPATRFAKAPGIR
mmetsp:Transcript_91460/g.285074  ORF Transcript_91460/g.285074 Transcript_91460/m.285074 type:complete len:241 (+) Transcript_91460:1126-1848(+)